MMNIRERAAYAWSRIVELFSPRKPEIEVEVEEITDDISFAEPDEEKVEQDYSPDDTAEIRLDTVGNYEVCVSVKDNLGNEAEKSFKITVS